MMHAMSQEPPVGATCLALPLPALITRHEAVRGNGCGPKPMPAVVHLKSSTEAIAYTPQTLAPGTLVSMEIARPYPDQPSVGRKMSLVGQVLSCKRVRSRRPHSGQPELTIGTHRAELDIEFLSVEGDLEVWIEELLRTGRAAYPTHPLTRP